MSNIDLCAGHSGKSEGDRLHLDHRGRGAVQDGSAVQVSGGSSGHRKAEQRVRDLVDPAESGELLEGVAVLGGAEIRRAFEQLHQTQVEQDDGLVLTR